MPRHHKSAAILILLLSGCAQHPAPDVDRFAPGAYAVRNSTVVLHDPQQDRDVQLQVSWPDAKGSFPVIAFSHGAVCFPQQYASITDFWVSHGYVVIRPDHLDSPNLGKVKPQDAPRLLDTRVRDMSFVLDELTTIDAQLSAFPGTIDPEHAAVAGHSFGGMIAMVKTGLTMQDATGTVLASYPDPRFRVAVIMSGVGQVPPLKNMPQVAYMTDDAFAGLARPLLASGGTLDEGNVGTGEVYPWQWRMSPYTLARPGDKYSLVLDNADHYLGGLICREDRGGEDDPQAVAVVRAVQTAFLDAYLKDDAAAQAWLVTGDLQGRDGGRAELTHR
jgi:pimeloyl-ACP methyl ester carboxylesterase